MNIDMISGLDRLPNFLADTMQPNISPDVAAEASVLANGGLDPCQYAVIQYHFCMCVDWWVIMSFNNTGLQWQPSCHRIINHRRKWSKEETVNTNGLQSSQLFIRLLLLPLKHFWGLHTDSMDMRWCAGL